MRDKSVDSEFLCVLRYQRSGKTITTGSCHKNIQDLDFFAIMPRGGGTPEENFDAVEDVEDHEDILAHIVDLSKKLLPS